MLRLAILSTIGFLLSSCATTESSRLGSASEGIAYMLPTGKLRLRVAEDGNGVLSVLIDGPIVAGDPANQFVTRLPQSGSADNDVTVTVDNKTNLLKKIEVTSTGQLTAIATNIAKSIAFLQASDNQSGTTFFAGIYDVDDLPAAGAAANAKVQEYFGMLCGRYRDVATLPFAKELKQLGADAAAEKKALAARLMRCRVMAMSGAADAGTRNLIRISVGPMAAVARVPDGIGGARARAVDPDAIDAKRCLKGVCYRPYTTRQVNLDVAGAFALSDVFLIPDPRSLIMVDLPAGAFAVQKYTLDFTDGVLTTYRRDGKSELVGLTALPIEVAKALLSAPAEALGLKQKKLEAQSSYLAAVDKSVAQQKTTADLCKTSPKLCPETAYKLIGGPVTADTKANGSAGDSGGAPAPAPTPTPSPTPTPKADGGAPNDGG